MKLLTPGEGAGVDMMVWLLIVPLLTVFGIPLLLTLWAWTSAAAGNSLLRYPHLVPFSPAQLSTWKRCVWVPFIGPLAYACALGSRRRTLGVEGWRAARADPVRLPWNRTYVPPAHRQATPAPGETQGRGSPPPGGGGVS